MTESYPGEFNRKELNTNFAVVANEVKSLAEETGRSADDINRLIQDLESVAARS